MLQSFMKSVSFVVYCSRSISSITSAFMVVCALLWFIFLCVLRSRPHGSISTEIWFLSDVWLRKSFQIGIYRLLTPYSVCAHTADVIIQVSPPRSLTERFHTHAAHIAVKSSRVWPYKTTSRVDSDPDTCHWQTSLWTANTKGQDMTKNIGSGACKVDINWGQTHKKNPFFWHSVIGKSQWSHQHKCRVNMSTIKCWILGPSAKN